MGYRITLDRGALRAELFARETVEETKAFFQAAISASRESRCPCVLISVRSSKPIFQVERHGLIEFFRELAVTSRRIALLGDSRDLRLSHEYVELIARQHGLNVRSLLDEAAAHRWFRDPVGSENGGVSKNGVVNKYGVLCKNDALDRNGVRQNAATPPQRRAKSRLKCQAQGPFVQASALLSSHARASATACSCGRA
jgi:hypothetical protein